MLAFSAALDPALQTRGRARLATLSTVPQAHLNDAICVLALSDFVHDSLRRCPQHFADWLSSAELEQADRRNAIALRAQALHACADEASLMHELRGLRTREMALIAWRDLSGHAGVEETIMHCAHLADVCIGAALDWLQKEFTTRFGAALNQRNEAQQLLVIAMGKLGGNELNFSSDIDLIFAYGDDGETTGPRVMEQREYFTRLGQRLIHVLSAPTAEGIVFRVDMRLRPYGDSGPLTYPLDALEEYYQDQGREWERFAMVKARLVHGDAHARERFEQIIRPFVFRRYIDYGVLEAIRRLKWQIAQDLRRKSRGDNIKLGAGGIREIEFIVQAHQLIRGGRDLALRGKSVLPMLQQIAVLGLLPAEEISNLRRAYLFLRKVENTLQELRDEQTQTLPADSEAQKTIAAALGHTDFAQLLMQLDEYRHGVHKIFRSVFGEPTPLAQDAEFQQPLARLWRKQLTGDAARELLREQGFADVDNALQCISQLRDAQTTRILSERGRQRLDALMPELLACCARGGKADIALPRVTQLLHAISRRTAYLELLTENKTMLTHLVLLCGDSAFVAEQLTHYPVLLDELLDSKTLYAPPQKNDMRADIQQALLRIANDDLEALLDALRECRHANSLRLAAAAVSDALDVGQISQRLTDLAEVTLEEVLELSWQQLVSKHGEPPDCAHEAGLSDKGFLIVAYGKFGGAELSFTSDLDLVFLFDRDSSLQTNGAKPIGVDQFYTRLAQRIVHFLSTRTAIGLLYEVDTRLRPSGNSGLLVSHWQGYEHYQHQDAWTWEHQALIRARPVAGSAVLAQRFIALRRDVLTTQRDASQLRSHVLDMRERMRSALDKSDAQYWELKHGRGGVVDIEFLVQYFVLHHARELGDAIDDTHSVRLLQHMQRIGALAEGDAALLIKTYKAYRETINRLALDGHGSRLREPEFIDARTSIIRLWRQYLE